MFLIKNYQTCKEAGRCNPQTKEKNQSIEIDPEMLETGK